MATDEMNNGIGIRKLTITFLRIIGVITLLSWAAATQSFADDQKGLAALKVGEEISVFVYTREFGERFGFSTLNTEAPTGELYAAEFRIEKKSDRDYGCELNIYFDNKLTVDYPIGEIGVYLAREHRIPNQRNWAQSKDREFFNTKNSQFVRRAFLASEDYVPNRGGVLDDLLITRYDKNQFIGITFIGFEIGGCHAAHFNPNVPMNMFVKKFGGRDYTKQIQYDPNDFFKFELPMHFRKIMLNLIEQTRSTKMRGDVGSSRK